MQRWLALVLLCLLPCGANAATPAMAVCSIATGTGSGSTDFTCSGITWTPGAAIVVLQAGTASGTAVATARMSVGFTDGTRQGSVSLQSRDTPGANTNTHGWGTVDSIAQLQVVASGSLDGEMAFSSCIAGGINANIGNAFA